MCASKHAHTHTAHRDTELDACILQMHDISFHAVTLDRIVQKLFAVQCSLHKMIIQKCTIFFTPPFTFHSAFHTLHTFVAILQFAHCIALYCIPLLTWHYTKVLVLCKTLWHSKLRLGPYKGGLIWVHGDHLGSRSSRIFLQRGGAENCHWRAER